MRTDFNDNKLGLFVHWGTYALTGFHEQAFARLNMDREKYEGLAKKFDPTKYDPEKWVLLAKNAGMKYVCFTAKHHDGFCMFDSAYTDYKITNTPYKKDVLKELSVACKKHGILLSVYYSLPDWHHPNAFNPNSTHQWKARTQTENDFSVYVEYVKNQITELLTNYGKIYTLFWDIPPHIEIKDVNALARKLQPDILINNRGFDEGDFSTPERDYDVIRGAMRFSRMTEACNAVGKQSWGFRKREDYHTLRYLLSSIDKVMAMGGSYLLNVGPKPDGTIDFRSESIIKAVGKFYNKLGGVLENTEPDPFDYGIESGTAIVNKKDGKTYFHFYNGLNCSAAYIKRFPSLPKRVRLLNSGKDLRYRIEKLPYDMEMGVGDAVLHIYSIPVENYPKEPIVIEIEW
ncbi:MAG: alpha-L-fucosidase [Clostridia bacterium]|nr:alpha-L-fucosidase [Clostridia bacterium]